MFLGRRRGGLGGGGGCGALPPAAAAEGSAPDEAVRAIVKDLARAVHDAREREAA